MRLWILLKLVGIKFDEFGGDVVGKRNLGIRGIWQRKCSRAERIQTCHWIIEGMNWQTILQYSVSGVSEDEMEWLRWRIEWKVFQSVRGLKVIFVRNLDLVFEISDLTKLKLNMNFLRLKGDFHDHSSWFHSCFAAHTSGLIHGVWGLCGQGFRMEW